MQTRVRMLMLGWVWLFAMASSMPLMAKTDTLQIKKPKAIYDVWYHAHDPNTLHAIDTSIFQLHRNDFVTRDQAEYLHLGNTGTAAYPLIFQPSLRKDFNTGFNQFDLYKYSLDSIRYYNAQRPYTELSYLLGLNLEQIFRGKFFHSTKVGFDYGVDFFQVNSKGAYNHQRAVDAGFYLYGKYTAKTNRWGAFTNLILNRQKVGENGGLQRDYFATDTSFFQKSLVPVQLSSATNTYNEWIWNAGGNFFLGKKINTRINDSTVINKIIPKFKIGYTFSLQANDYFFRDTKPDSLYYGAYSYLPDSLISKNKFLKIGNEINFDWIPQRLSGDSSIKQQFLAAGATLRFDSWIATTSTGKSPFVNSSVEGYVKSNTAFRSPIHFDARVKYFFSGYNLNDLSVSGRLQYQWKEYLQIKAKVNYSLSEPSFIYDRFSLNNAHYWVNDFKKQNELNFGGGIAAPKYGVGVEVENTLLQNRIYFDLNGRPTQESSPVNVFMVHIYNRNGFKGFHIDNDIWIQKITGNNIIRLPFLVTKHSIYYERRIVKNIMWFAVGFDVRFNTEFNANGYNPLTGQFYLQDNKKMFFKPGVDLFLNLKIKTVRISLLGNNLSQLIAPKPNYNAYLYPTHDASFRFMVAWRFLE